MFFRHIKIMSQRLSKNTIIRKNASTLTYFKVESLGVFPMHSCFTYFEKPDRCKGHC